MVLNKKRIVFIRLAGSIDVYKNSKISISVPLHPLISLAQLSAVSRQAGYTPFVLDLAVKRKNSPKERLIKAIKEIKPEYVGVTFTTPLSKESIYITNLVKEIRPETKILAGGCHTTIMTQETLKNKNVDIA